MVGSNLALKAVEFGNELQKSFVAQIVKSHGYDCPKPIALASMEHKEGWVLMCQDSFNTETQIFTLEDDVNGQLMVIPKYKKSKVAE